ncbi:MAG: VIT1/CCC1 family protein [Nanoarchaeota archaeon]|nr:VIT1/CCC1 family protein [Nanoarchaeota archaeon]MBU1622772.1 VIT1/CCC1 family protein [Nanoarchaeota archaeon]
MLSKKIKKEVLTFQKYEILEHFVYRKISHHIKNPANKRILEQISKDELKHYHFWKKHSGIEIKPSKLKRGFYYLVSKILGITFAIKIMIKREQKAQKHYKDISEKIPGVKKLIADEKRHEQHLINMFDEERLHYTGAIVVGLNDALVELTGALAGFTLALGNTHLIALVGSIIGITTGLSAGASQYLETETEKGTEKKPFKAAVYTGFSYILTSLFLIFPFFIFINFYLALGITLFNAFLVILFFSFYLSVVKDFSFKRRFLHMALIGFGVAILAFGIGFLVRKFLGVEI